MAQTVFKRVENKYLITQEQCGELISRLSGMMEYDKYDAYTISNIYYDTDNYALVRTSIEKPVYKEKLRIRSYSRAEAGSDVFVELKRKYDGTVYKRRAAMPCAEAFDLLAGRGGSPGDSQILKEIRWFTRLHDLVPSAFIAYNRRAFSGIADPELRVTFDSEILFRQSELRLDAGVWGAPLLAPGELLMEIKAGDALPMWLCRILSEMRIFPSSFSKYGVGYTDHILGRRPAGTEVAASA